MREKALQTIPMTDEEDNNEITTGTVVQWAFRQGEYLTATQTLVLAYLAAHAFIRDDNAEDAPAGAVMRKFSYADNIMKSTGIRSRNTLRTTLNSLQAKGYIQRQERLDDKYYGGLPHVIFVLWWAGDVQEQIRNGGMIPAELLVVPGAKHRRKSKQPRHLATVTPLRTVNGCQSNDQ